MATVDDLVKSISQSDYMTRLRARFDAWGTPWRAWKSLVNVGLAMSQFVTEALAENRTVQVDLAKAQFLSTAEADGLTLYAKSRYGLDRYPAQFAQHRFLLTSSAAAPQHSPGVGGVVVGTPGTDGLLFSSLEAFTLAAGGTRSVAFISIEADDKYNLPANSSLELKTSLAGVTVTNPPCLVVPGIDGDENGGLILTRKTILTGPTTIKLVIAGSATPLSVTTPGNGVVVNLATNGTGAPTSTAAQVVTAIQGNAEANNRVYAQALGTGNGLAGDLIETALSTSVVVAGQDEEADGTVSPPTALKGRCILRWQTLGDLPTAEVLAYRARLAPSGRSASPVTRVKVLSNLSGTLLTDNAATVIVAGPAGALSPADLALVGTNFPAYFFALLLRTTINKSILIVGTVSIFRNSGVTQAQALTNITAKLAEWGSSIEIGGGKQQKVFKNRLEAKIVEANIVATSNVDLSSPVGDTILLVDETPVWDLSGLTVVLVD